VEKERELRVVGVIKFPRCFRE